MGIITKPTTFADGTVPTASQFNGDFDTIYSEFNGNITNANISASAAIVLSKITGTSNSGDLTLIKPTINGVQSITTDVDGSTITFSMATSSFHTVTLGGNRTLAVSNVTVGQPFFIRLIQDATGTRTVTWFSTIIWVDGTAPTLTTTAGKIDTFAFIPTSTGNYDGYIVGQNIG